ncbi:cytochrome b [Rhodoplanes roseus]|uniref:Cytochrome B n=1 Tax=Rhodoplanes roseus TaxID=29409 RepID=A0A327L0M1_9BRAD|nr:cytochrome b [Rhodoplanes roseus]RAI41208.1 cytochrome B [Rhodoplanes roseus]
MTAVATSPDRTSAGYTATARAFHWITAAIVIGMIPGGIYMANAEPGPAQDLAFNLHRSFGVVLLPLVLARFLYRLKNPPPPLPRDIPLRQRAIAHAVHGILYALLIVQPLVGWIATSAYRAPITVFWLFELPPIWPQDRPFSEALFGLHQTFGILIALLAIAHIAAALYHQFVRRDDVLLRMWRG